MSPYGFGAIALAVLAAWLSFPIPIDAMAVVFALLDVAMALRDRKPTPRGRACSRCHSERWDLTPTGTLMCEACHADFLPQLAASDAP